MADDPFNLLSTAITSIDPALLSLSLPCSPTFSSDPFYPSTSPPSTTQSAIHSPADLSYPLDISPPNRAQSQPPETASTFQVPLSSRIRHANPPTQPRHAHNDHARYHPYSRPQPLKEPRKPAPTSAPRPFYALPKPYSSTPQLRRSPSPYTPPTTESTPQTHRSPSPFLNTPNLIHAQPPQPQNPTFTLHQNTTTLSLGLQSHLSRLQHACSEMQTFLSHGFNTSDNDTADINTLLGIEKYAASPPPPPPRSSSLSQFSKLITNNLSQRLHSRNHNRTLTELHELLSPLPLFPLSAPSTTITSPPIPRTGLDIRRLNHDSTNNLLDHYSLPFSPTMFLHEKKALYLRFLGAGRALMHRVLD